MGEYFISACHDCQTKVMWAKSYKSTCLNWHNKWSEGLHKNHSVDFGSDDYDEKLYERTKRSGCMQEMPYIWDEQIILDKMKEVKNNEKK